jgi:hypothetical protein
MIAKNFMMGRAQTEGDQDIKEEDVDWHGILGEKRSKWSEYRAVIISKPKEAVIANIGEIVNDTNRDNELDQMALEARLFPHYKSKAVCCFARYCCQECSY